MPQVIQDGEASPRIILRNRRRFAFTRVSRDQTLATGPDGSEYCFTRVFEYARAGLGAHLIPHPRYADYDDCWLVPMGWIGSVRGRGLCERCAFRTRACCCQLTNHHTGVSLCRPSYRLDLWSGYWNLLKRGRRDVV